MLGLGRTKTFGGIPGEIQPYGFASLNTNGALYTVVNPAQAVNTIELPRLSQEQASYPRGRVLFTDKGFHPDLSGHSITLGPEQMALVGFGTYATPEHDMGMEDDVVIPRSIEPLRTAFEPRGDHATQTSITPQSAGVLRIVMRESTPDGYIRRTWAGGPPKGQNMGNVFRIEVTQNGRTLPVHINYDKVIWSGLSWAVGEVDGFTPGQALTIRCSSTEKDSIRLNASLYRVAY